MPYITGAWNRENDPELENIAEAPTPQAEAEARRAAPFTPDANFTSHLNHLLDGLFMQAVMNNRPEIRAGEEVALQWTTNWILLSITGESYGMMDQGNPIYDYVFCSLILRCIRKGWKYTTDDVEPFAPVNVDDTAGKISKLLDEAADLNTAIRLTLIHAAADPWWSQSITNHLEEIQGLLREAN